MFSAPPSLDKAVKMLNPTNDSSSDQKSQTGAGWKIPSVHVPSGPAVAPLLPTTSSAPLKKMKKKLNCIQKIEPTQ